MAHQSVSTILRTSITTLLTAQAQPTFWQSLSLDEQNGSKDFLHPEKCCGRPAWSVKGKLRDFWNEKVHPTIVTICTGNYRRIYRKGGQHAWCSYHIYLLAHEQTLDAWPTIVIRTKDRAVARRTEKLIMKHEMYKDLNTGFEIEIDTRITLELAGPMELETYTHQMAGSGSDTRQPPRLDGYIPSEVPSYPPPKSLCGAGVIVAPLPTEPGLEWRRATIAITLLLEGKPYALLPAHVFFNHQIQEMEGEEVGAEFTEGSDSDISSENSLGPTSWSLESVGRRQSESIPAAHAVYLDVGSKEESSYRLDRVTVLEMPPDALHIGSLRPPQVYERSNAGRPLFSAKFDWALIEIKNHRFRLENLVVDQSGLKIRPWFSAYDDGAWEEPVVVVAGMSGVNHALLSATACSITPPWSAVPQRAWELQLALGKSDYSASIIQI